MPVTTRSQNKSNNDENMELRELRNRISLLEANVKKLEATQISYPDPIIECASRLVGNLCHTHNIDPSHGIEHAHIVLRHLDKAINFGIKDRQIPISKKRIQAMRLAALLHDVDDKKYFDTHQTLKNARTIMIKSYVEDDILEDALMMIRLVSCSKNGNSYPERAILEPEILWPRWADRLEAVGEIGIARCFYFSIHKGDKLYDSETPQCLNRGDILKTATPERIENYQANNGKSKSMMDHYYDKLIQIACPPKDIVKNMYLENISMIRAEPLFKVCMRYSQMCHIKNDDSLKLEKYRFFNDMHNLCKKYGLILEGDKMYDLDYAMRWYQ